MLTILALAAPAVFAQTNVVEWQTNWPAGGTNAIFVNQQNLPATSAWYTGTKAFLVGVSNGDSTNLVATVPSGSSLTWWTYFAPVGVTNNSSNFSLTNTTSTPIQLSPGNTIQVTMDFNVVNSAAQNTGRSLRFALLDSGTNANVTGGGNAQNNFLTGYGQNMNFGTTFGIAPLQTFANTNSGLTGKAVLSTTAALDTTLGANSGGTTNDPGFVDGTNYTLVFLVTENNPTNVSITTTFWGNTFLNGSNITQTVTDTNYCYTNFDTFVMRPALGSQTALTFNITSFQVATITPSSSVNLTPPIIAHSFSGGNLTLMWPLDHTGWTLQSQTNTLTSTWVSVPDSSATNEVIVPIDISQGAVFYRLTHP
jgi:hypothetical protein